MAEEQNEENEIIKSAIGEPVEQGSSNSSMEQSILNQEDAQNSPMTGAMTQQYTPAQSYEQPVQQDYQQAPAEYQQYPQDYSSPQTQYSSDTISEISEQVVTEKLSQIKDQLEKVIDFKTTVDAKIEFVEQRLLRIEKIIDRLQLSILQRVGEYVTNVEDMKKELIETQKSFKAMSDKHKLSR